MNRQREIEQGLREESGALTFCLVVEEYSQGHADFEAKTPPPDFSTPSYDLGRFRASEKAEATADLMARLEREADEGRQRIRDMLKDRPDLLAEYDEKIAAIRKA